MAELSDLELETSEMAALLDLTPRRIQQLAAEGVLVRTRRGYYGLLDSIRGYVAWLTGEQEGGPKDQERAARARKMEAEAELKERQVSQLRGETVTLDFMVSEFERGAALLAAEIRNVPPRRGADVRPDDPAEGELLLEEITNELLQTIATAFATEDDDASAGVG